MGYFFLWIYQHLSELTLAIKEVDYTFLIYTIERKPV